MNCVLHQNRSSSCSVSCPGLRSPPPPHTSPRSGCSFVTTSLPPAQTGLPHMGHRYMIYPRLHLFHRDCAYRQHSSGFETPIILPSFIATQITASQVANCVPHTVVARWITGQKPINARPTLLRRRRNTCARNVVAPGVGTVRVRRAVVGTDRAQL